MILLSGQPIAPTIFPDGTSQVWKIDEALLMRYTPVVVTWRFEREEELIHLAQLKSLLDAYHMPAELDLPYLPYARQDKAVANDATFALYAFAKLINVMQWKSVVLHDAHSKEASRLLQSSQEHHFEAEVHYTMGRLGCGIICYPDKGAFEKYSGMYGRYDFVVSEKVRDAATGAILQTAIDFTGNVTGHDVLIVDDICDGGATFIGLAKALRQAGASAVHLFVSHGLFTKGTKVLRDSGISRIFTPKGEITE
jgi:ribose-phosphate pyrophosphokinase